MKIHEGQKTKELTATVRSVKGGSEKHGYTYQLTEEEHKAMKLMALEKGMKLSDLLSLWIREHRESSGE